MSSYKEANERLNQTGGGFDGIELTTFHEWIVKNVCKYYFELDSVLKDRPNVKPWFTNEDDFIDEGEDEEKDNRNNMSIDSVNDDDSLESLGEEFNTFNSEIEVEDRVDTTVIDPDTSGNDEYEKETRESSSTLLSTNRDRRNLSLLSDDSESISMDTATNMSTSDECDTPTSSSSKKKRKGSLLGRRKLTPIEAKSLQKSYIKKKNKSIANRKGSDIISKFTTMDEDDRQRIMETKNEKMTFERERHSDLKRFESQKLLIEKERLEMEKVNMLMRKDQMLVQTNLEKSRIILLKLEMLKAREGIKKEFPNVTEEYLNTTFPYPE